MPETQPTIQRMLAFAFVAGRFEEEELVRRGEKCLGARPLWLRPLARRLAAAFPRRTTVERIAEFIRHDRSFQRAWFRKRVRVRTLQTIQHEMTPAPCASDWGLPVFSSVGAFDEWLDTPANVLDALADWRGWERCAPPGPLQNYHYRLLRKSSGGVRILETPKHRLKTVQRRLLSEVLEHIPPHEAAHGFRKERSVKTFAAPHVGKRVVLRMDLRRFFLSISRARVVGLLMIAGYPEPVAKRFAALCVNVLPKDMWESWRDEMATLSDGERLQMQALYDRPHLPQGAPTSPALANLCAYRLDLRLNGLATSAGAMYTRYADDLLFSGDRGFERRVRRFVWHAGAIILDEGFTPHFGKTQVMRQGVRQYAAGVVVNQHTNVCRKEFDRLKDILFNCARRGPESQNLRRLPDFKAHLMGKIAHISMLNPERGNKLRRLFDQINWV